MTRASRHAEAGRDPVPEGSGLPNGPRRLARRRSLPGGRAVVGGFLVAAAAVGVFAAYFDATSGPEQSWVVAATDVVAGRQLGPEHLGLASFDLPPELAERAFTDPADVTGAVTTARLTRFDLVLATHLADGRAAGTEQMSFGITRARAVAGALRAGDRVDVLVSYRGEPAAAAVVTEVLVLDVDTGEGGLTSRDDLVLTVALPGSADALALAHAIDNGDLHVVRTTGRDAAVQVP